MAWAVECVAWRERARALARLRLRALGAPLTPPNWPAFNLPSLEALLGGPASENTLVEAKEIRIYDD